MVAPAAGFYSTPGVGLDEVRIAYVLNKEDLIKSVAILKEALQAFTLTNFKKTSQHIGTFFFYFNLLL